jgi:hypothetical protein
VADEDIRFKRRDGSEVTDDDVTGQLLLEGGANVPTATFAFSNNAFVPGACSVFIQGVAVEVLVHVKDVSSARGLVGEPASGENEEKTGEIPTGQPFAFHLAAGLVGAALLAAAYMLYNQDSPQTDGSQDSAEAEARRCVASEQQQQQQQAQQQQQQQQLSETVCAPTPADAKMAARPVYYALALGTACVIVYALCSGLGASPGATTVEGPDASPTSSVQFA